jgi:hypothetical protein
MYPFPSTYLIGLWASAAPGESWVVGLPWVGPSACLEGLEGLEGPFQLERKALGDEAGDEAVEEGEEEDGADRKGPELHRRKEDHQQGRILWGVKGIFGLR